MDWQKHDHYALLGITRMASEEEIRRAYRLKALEHHPDRFPLDSPERESANQRFQALTDARDTLLDTQRRHRYDAEQDLVQQAWLDSMVSQYQVPLKPPVPKGKSFRDTLYEVVESASQRDKGLDIRVGEEEQEEPQQGGKGIPPESRQRTAALYYAQGLRYAARGHYRRALYALNNAQMLDPEIDIPPHIMSKIRVQAYYSKR